MYSASGVAFSPGESAGGPHDYADPTKIRVTVAYGLLSFRHSQLVLNSNWRIYYIEQCRTMTTTEID
jgi:hypothetical protein